MPGGPANRPWPILKDYPSAVAEVGDRWDNHIWAYGSLSEDGSIRSLTQWNSHRGMIAFTGSTPACKPTGYVGGDLVETNVGAVLDWAFRHQIFLLFDGKAWCHMNAWPLYLSELWRIRGWDTPKYSAAEAEAMIASKIQEAVQRYDAIARESVR